MLFDQLLLRLLLNGKSEQAEKEQSTTAAYGKWIQTKETRRHSFDPIWSLSSEPVHCLLCALAWSFLHVLIVSKSNQQWKISGKLSSSQLQF